MAEIRFIHDSNVIATTHELGGIARGDTFNGETAEFSCGGDPVSVTVEGSEVVEIDGGLVMNVYIKEPIAELAKMMSDAIGRQFSDTPPATASSHPPKPEA